MTDAAITELQAKHRFAALMLQHPENPRRCAEIIVYAVRILNAQGQIDTNVITLIAQNWPNDEIVLAERARLLEEHGEDAFLPSKQDLARLVWGIAENDRKDTEDRLKAAKQYADLMGFVEKSPQVQVTVNRVMHVKDYGNDDNWERRALEQQRKMIEHV